MTGKTNDLISRRKLLGAFAGITMVSATPYYANAAGYLKGAGNIRKVNLRNQRTGESLNTIYWVEGQYIKPALEEINYFMRDWRQKLHAQHGSPQYRPDGRCAEPARHGRALLGSVRLPHIPHK